jgi:hypothetical protein
MVKIVPNPKFKPEGKEEAAAFEAVKKAGAIDVPHVTAVENMRLSRGASGESMYVLESQAKEPEPAEPEKTDDDKKTEPEK